MKDGVGPDRSAAEIERLLDLRAERAVAHFRAQAEAGPTLLCPVCGHEGRFSPVRHKPSIWCPGCDSRPRHRLLKLWLAREAAIQAGAGVLHFAAEPWVREALAHAGEYVTADLNDRFEAVVDIEAMPFAAGRWDVVIANHVLEHVDDGLALAEIARVLTPGGLAVLTVPLVEGWSETLEAPADLDAATRARLLTDPDHRRFYGRDFRERLRRAGFEVDEFTAVEPDVSRHGLHRGEKIFLARTPMPGAPPRAPRT